MQVLHIQEKQPQHYYSRGEKGRPISQGGAKDQEWAWLHIYSHKTSLPRRFGILVFGLKPETAPWFPAKECDPRGHRLLFVGWRVGDHQGYHQQAQLWEPCCCQHPKRGETRRGTGGVLQQEASDSAWLENSPWNCQQGTQQVHWEQDA